MINPKILIGREFSGVIRDAFRRRGYDAWSNDIIDTERCPEWHLKMDILDAINFRKWDRIIINIPCTAMAVSGNGTYAGTKARQDAIDWSISVWDAAVSNSDWVVMENPQSVLFPALRKHSGCDVQYIQPYQFGHPEQKKTGLALHKAPRLKPTKDVYGQMLALPQKERERIWYMSPGKDRRQERSRFLPGIADAMAQQYI